MQNSLLFKVVLWRIISVVLTLVTTWVYTGDIKHASGVTLVLHLVLIVGHYSFEFLWEKYVHKDREDKE